MSDAQEQQSGVKQRRVVGIVQARMGASRLPNKMLLHLHGHAVVSWVQQRCLRAKQLDKLVFAIPDTVGDDVLAAFVERSGTTVVRGSEQDVLGRCYKAARQMEATHVVRICADNPFISPREIDRLVMRFFDTPCDYLYNHIPKGNRYADGLGAEMTSMETLSLIHRRARLQQEREHLFNHIWNNPGQFRIATFDPDLPELARPDLKLDLDTMEDYRNLLKRPLSIEMEASEIVEKFG